MCVEQINLALIFLNVKGIIGEISEEVQQIFNYVADNTTEEEPMRDIDVEVVLVKHQDEVNDSLCAVKNVIAV